MKYFFVLLFCAGSYLLGGIHCNMATPKKITNGGGFLVNRPANYQAGSTGEPQLIGISFTSTFIPNITTESPTPLPVNTTSNINPSTTENSRTTTSLITNMCDNKHGDLMPDPYSCESFYQCVWSKPHLLYCPTGLYFDNIYHVCNFPRNVTCESN